MILASAATVIASQAVISGAFSITRQAIQLGYLPRLEVRHTSETEIGQIYVPRINCCLLVAVIVLVLGFQTSDNLGAAYGIAVSGMMAITTGLAFVYMRSCGAGAWRVAVPLFGFFALVDLAFLSRQPAEDRGGRLVPAGHRRRWSSSSWGPGGAAAGCWPSERARDALPLEPVRRDPQPGRPVRVPGTAVFMTRDLTRCRSRCCTTSSTTRRCTSASS